MHKCEIVVAKFNYLGFLLFPYLPNSPDLTLSDYFLFADRKKWLSPKIFDVFHSKSQGLIGQKVEINRNYLQNVKNGTIINSNGIVELLKKTMFIKVYSGLYNLINMDLPLNRTKLKFNNFFS